LSYRSRGRHEAAAGRRGALPAVVAGTLGLQAAAMTVPALRNVLGLTALSAADWALVAGATTLPFILKELRRQGDTDGIASEATPVH
jgi:hypothetical protein